MTPEPPFDKSKRLTAIIRVPESDRNPLGHDVPNAYCVETLEGFGGCVVWGWYERRQEWIANVQERWLVTHLLTLVGEMYDPTSCRLDHHGYCQEHGYFSNSPCPHKRARELFE